MTRPAVDPLSKIFERLDAMAAPERNRRGTVPDEAYEAVIAALSRGFLLKDACSAARVGVSTMYARAKVEPQFARRVESAKIEGAQARLRARFKVA